MLTEIQKTNIIDLIDKCEDIQLKTLIETASKNWIDNTITPVQNDYGVKIVNQIYESVDYKSCLIASAMIGEKCSGFDCEDKYHIGYFLKSDASEKFNISFDRISQIIRRFDGNVSDSNEPILTELKEILFS